MFTRDDFHNNKIWVTISLGRGSLNLVVIVVLFSAGLLFFQSKKKLLYFKPLVLLIIQAFKSKNKERFYTTDILTLNLIM